jgi:hypothetical protein
MTVLPGCGIVTQSLQRRVAPVVHLQHVLANREDACSLRAPLACTADGVRSTTSTRAQRSEIAVAKTVTLLLRSTRHAGCS